MTLLARVARSRMVALLGAAAPAPPSVDVPVTASILVANDASLTAVQAAGYTNARKIAGGGIGLNHELLPISQGAGDALVLQLPQYRVTNRGGSYVISGSTSSVFDVITNTSNLALQLPPCDATWNRHRVEIWCVTGTITLSVPSGSYLNGVLNGTLAITAGQVARAIPDPNAAQPTWRARPR